MTRLAVALVLSICIPIGVLGCANAKEFEALQSQVVELDARVKAMELVASQSQKDGKCSKLLSKIKRQRKPWKQCIEGHAEMAWEWGGTAKDFAENCQDDVLPLLKKAKGMKCVYKDADRPLHGLLSTKVYDEGTGKNVRLDMANYMK